MINELSIVIPALNEERYLPDLLDSIVSQTYDGKLQVIVVDGQSTDKTHELARSFSDRISDLTVLQTRPDIGHQRNLGASHAKYRYLLFLDADVVLPEDLLQRLFSKISIPEPFVICTMHTSSKINVIDQVFLLWVYALLFSSWIARIPAINGDFILTTRGNHKQVKGFVEGAILGEDIDYAIRSVKLGARYHYFLRPKIIASARRVREMGRIRLLALWTRGYLHVLKHGPIFPNQGFEYRFGQYGPRSADPSRTSKNSRNY